LLAFFPAILFLASTAFAASGQITLNPSNINFGGVAVGTSQTQAVTLTNSGGTRVTIMQTSLSGTGFTIRGLTYPLTLAGGQSVTGQVTFAPQSSGTDSSMASISFNTMTGRGHGLGINNTVKLPLSGTGMTSGQLTASPTNLAFGNVQVGSSQTVTETLTNSGGSSVTISAAGATGIGFTTSGLILPLSVSVGQSVSFSVTFAPASGNTVSGNLAITSNASNSALSVPLSGTGATPGQLTAGPTTLSFGSVTTGSSASLAEKLTNTGGSALTISQITPSGAGFSFSGITLPVTLAVNQSVTFNALFAPQTAGSVTGGLAISSNGSNPSLSVPLSGTGASAGQITASPVSLSFGNVTTGGSSMLAEKLTNSGGSAVTISQISASGTGFSVSGVTLPVTLSASQSVTFNALFAPQTAGSVTGSLAINSNGSNPSLSVALSGTGASAGQLTASPANLSFGNVTTGSASSISEKLTNSGGSAVTISQISASGTGFSFAGITLPLTLAASQSVTFNASFAPQTAGSASGSLVISSNGSNPTFSVAATGTGTSPGQLAISPSTVNFGSVTVGTTQNQTGTLTATNSSVTVTSLGVSGSQFSVSGLTLPVTIAAGVSVGFQLTFAPQTSGSASANVNFASNASNSPSVEVVTGSGVMPQHSVNLGWNSSTSSGVVGYNVYRGTVSGGPYTRINPALDAAPNDTDNTVVGGQTYYYVVTAVDSSGTESGYSNQTQAVIPSP
jgi:hypothetical protein